MNQTTDYIRRHPALRWANAAILAVIVAAMMLLIAFAYQTIEAERAERRQAEQTSEILVELRNVYRAALNGETGQRGYLLSLDRRYLESYRLGRNEIEPALKRLRALIAADGSQEQDQLLDEIDSLARAKFEELDRTVVLTQRGDLLEARRTVLTDEGIEAMERLRRATMQLGAIETQQLDAATAETRRAEARVLPILGGLVLLLLAATWAGFNLVARSARAEAEARQAAELEEARDRADLLAKELNHRVKNLFAVILAIVQMSGRDAPEAKPVLEKVSERIRALLKAHEVTQGSPGDQSATLGALIETTLAPYRSTASPADIAGPEVRLPAKRLTPLGLVLHEMTTNAVKYGAWSQGGTIDVAWSRQGEDIVLIWREPDVSVAGEPGREGFGSMLMTSAARQLGGTIEREFTPGGLVVTITFPAEA